MPYTAEAVANFFVDKANVIGTHDLSPMKLQKLVYFAHGWYLAIRDEPLLAEPIQAWRFGPVVYSIYREFKDFGDQPITRRAKNIRFINGKLQEFEPSIYDEPGDHAFTAALLTRVWEVYGHFSAIQLTNITHELGTPWQQVDAQYADAGLPRGIDIPNDLIKEHFKKLLGAEAAV